MVIRALFLGIAAAAAFSPIPTMSAVTADDVQKVDARSCAVSAKDAVDSLPAPLSRFAQIRCTSHGQVITGHEGWLWVEPIQEAMVVIPSGDMAGAQDPASAKAYFTKIQVTKIKGDEYDRAIHNFRSVFDRTEGKPAGYRVDVTTAGGDGLELYFFDYFTYGWGISCPSGQCDLSSRFIIFNLKQKPVKLAAPI